MDARQNPYTPGAGSSPSHLVGREALIEEIWISLDRLRAGAATRPIILIGLRGVGKTVMIEHVREQAEEREFRTIVLEARETTELPAVMLPQLKALLLRLSRTAAARDLAVRALRGLAGFVGAMKIRYDEVELALDLEPEPGFADSGDFEFDLFELFAAVGAAAAAANTAIILFIDEMQHLREPEMISLIAVLHRIAQRKLPITLLGAGLPSLPARMGSALTYVERLVEFRTLGALSEQDTKIALMAPAQSQGVEIEADALDEIRRHTRGYPYFVQEWGRHAWNVAERSPITVGDVEAATTRALSALDESFFRVRLDQLSPAQLRYARAMAELGAGRHRSSEIANVLGKRASDVGKIRSQLINKGTIWSPAYGEAEFSVPMFEGFMKRLIPDFERPSR